MGNIHFSITNYFPGPLSSSRPRLAVRVSSHVVGSCIVLFMSLSLAPTRFTAVADVHTVYLHPTVSPHVSDVFYVHPIGICLASPIPRQSRSPVVSSSFFLDLSDQCSHGFVEVGDGIAL